MFAHAHSETLLGRVLRLPFRLLPSEIPLPIPFGPRRGLRWVMAASVRSCWLGLYETQKTKEILDLLKNGDVFLDIGAQAGYHTLLASRVVGSAGAVYAFEPLPRNLEYLRQHLQLNAASNVNVIAAAVSDRDGEVAFDPGPSYVAGHIAEGGSLRVECVSLDSMYRAGRLPAPRVIKIDVEGAELRVLEGARNVIQQTRPVILLDTHDFLGGESSGIHQKCCDLLKRAGYRLTLTPPPGPGAIDVLAIPE